MKPWIFMAAISLLGSCSWLQHLGHRHDESEHVLEHEPGSHGREEELGHPHDEHDHRMYGGWDSSQYPTAVNLYRAMNLIAETRDPADSGRPSHAEMFVATFSESYVKYKPDSLVMQQLRGLLANAEYILFSGASWDEGTQVQFPRLTRVLDLLQYDSSVFHYRSRGLNGAWYYRSDIRESIWPADTSYAVLEVYMKGGKHFTYSGDRLYRPESCLLDSWRP